MNDYPLNFPSIKIQGMKNKKSNETLVKYALYLSVFTIAYNIAEGIVSIFYGASDETLALFGFGLDSFVEVISGVGILHMILRMKLYSVQSRDDFERTALKVTGISFYILALGLIIASVLLFINNSSPSSTVAGIIISVISILIMYMLMKLKMNIGTELKSDAIIADANCTKTCFYLSLILLASSLSYEVFRINYLDIIGSIGISYYAFKEGKESLDKSKSNHLKCSCEND